MGNIATFTTRLFAGLPIVLLAGACLPGVASARSESGQVCGGTHAAGLDELFGGQVGRVVGADYARPFALPDGTTLILLQDVFLAPSDAPVATLGTADFAHNAGVQLDAGGCVVRTVTGRRAYVGGDLTRNLSRWFWAMGGGIGADGRLHVFVAELRNPNGTGAASGAVPVATWRATIDPDSLDVVDLVPAADAGVELYGWSVASDADFSYLFAHCYRQFVPDEWLGHDLSCTGDIRVGRVAAGRFADRPEYFTGSGWSTDPARAAPLAFPGARNVNPVSIQYIDRRFVSVSKVDDWWGTTILVDTAPAATGPWVSAGSFEPPAKCDGCNTYFASLMPWRQDDGALVVALSNNAWDMHAVAFATPSIYRCSFHAFELPVAPRPPYRRPGVLAPIPQ